MSILIKKTLNTAFIKKKQQFTKWKFLFFIINSILSLKLDLIAYALKVGGDLGLFFASGQDGAPDYTEFSYGLGPVSLSYGTYDDVSDNITLSYGFACGSYECGLTMYDMTDEGYGTGDEDGIFFSISASL